MCKDCTCKKTIDFSEMAKDLIVEFGNIMPPDCLLFLCDIGSGKDVLKIWKKEVETKYPLH
jgi:hypothetical protein